MHTGISAILRWSLANSLHTPKVTLGGWLWGLSILFLIAPEQTLHTLEVSVLNAIGGDSSHGQADESGTGNTTGKELGYQVHGRKDTLQVGEAKGGGYE